MRNMKDSGVEWIGAIPMHWNISRNKNLIYEINDRCDANTTLPLLSVSEYYGVAPKAERIEEGAFLSRAESLEGYKICQPNDVAMNIMLAWKRAQAVSKYHGIISPAYCVYRKREDALLNMDYFHYLIRSDLYVNVFKRYSTGIIESRLRLYPEKFLALYSHLPPVEEQEQIARTLDKKSAQVDTLVANVQSQIEKLKAYKQGVITEVVTKGLDPTVPMKDSGVEWIGAVPAHWSIIPSKFLFANCDERRRANDVQLTASQKYGMISQEEYMRRENSRIVLADKGLENWKHVEPFDFVISLRSFQGGLEMSEVTGCATWHYIVLRARQEIHPYYYKWLFKSPMYITALQRTCNYIRDGQDLRYSNFVKVPLCIPTLDEQRQIADYLDKKCDQIDRLIAIKQAKIEKLEQYKRSLIYEYVTGKKEVTA